MPLGSQSILLVLCPANVVTRPLPEQAPCYLSLGIPLIPCAPSTYASAKPFARMQKSGRCVDCRALKSPFLSSVLYSGERGLAEVRFSRSLPGCLGPFPAARGALGLSAQVPVRDCGRQGPAQCRDSGSFLVRDFHSTQAWGLVPSLSICQFLLYC